MSFFNVGDAVRYVGSTLVNKYPGDLKQGKVGEVISRVSGEPNMLVVSFGGEVFTCHACNLVRHTFKDKAEIIEPVVEKIAKKWDTSAED